MQKTSFGLHSLVLSSAYKSHEPMAMLAQAKNILIIQFPMELQSGFNSQALSN
nr:Putative uncharacterized protein [Moritella viscosa]